MKLFVQLCECPVWTPDDLTISYWFYTYLNTPSTAAFHRYANLCKRPLCNTLLKDRFWDVFFISSSNWIRLLPSLKAQVTHYLESFGFDFRTAQQEESMFSFFPPYFWRQTWTDLFWITKRVSVPATDTGFFMSFQSSVYLSGHSFSPGTLKSLCWSLGAEPRPALWQESLDLKGLGVGGEVFLQLGHFLYACH